jgi:hypothetical protein
MTVQAQMGGGIRLIRNLALEGDGRSEEGSDCFNPRKDFISIGQGAG